jgi:hypothetical protein
MGIGCGVDAPGGELEVRAGAREVEEHAVIPLMALKAPDLREPHPIAIEADDRLEVVRVSGQTYLHARMIATPR